MSQSANTCKVVDFIPRTPPRSPEWKAQKRWNPFNSYKLLVHVNRWATIQRGRPVPPPVLITVDPINICNFDCAWCNAEHIRKHRNFRLSEQILTDLADFLPRWGQQQQAQDGVQAICVAGGGEPLLNPATPGFIDRVIAKGIEVGVVTNGSRIHEAVDALAQCTWLGVSVDAGTAATFDRHKGLKPGHNTFQQVIDNITLLVDYAKRHKKRLGLPHPSYGVSYKYLLYPGNIGEIYEAAKLAKGIGCRNIHYRPAGTTWDKLGTAEEIHFSQDDIGLFNEQIALAQELDDDTFNVYGVTHKFSDQFDRANAFAKCYSVFMTAVISPSTHKEAAHNSFVMGLCCDRRGDGKLELLSDCEDVSRINQAWGSDAHWRIHDQIEVARDCPRCTYQPHNQIYEQVILNDSMTCKFI